MSFYLISPAARGDLFEIWDYYAIEVRNLEAADRIRDELFTAMRALADTPGMGHVRRDLSMEPVRFWRVRNYLIIYRTQASGIEVVRVLHGARDIRALLNE